jgi:hypothetical protein
MKLDAIRTVMLQTLSLIATKNDKIFSADQFHQFGNDIKCFRDQSCFQQEAMMYWGKTVQFTYVFKYAAIIKTPLPQTIQT